MLLTGEVNTIFLCAVSMTSATQNIKAKFNSDFAYFKQRDISQTDDSGLSQG